MNSSKLAAVGAGLFAAALASAQVPDVLTALDAGGRSMGAGGALGATNADTLSSFLNPAGLGYLTKAQIGITYRNLPQSRTSLTGSYERPNRNTRGDRGDNAITHFGYAFPFARLGGTLALSYTLGGYIDDTAVTGPGVGLPSDSGAFTVGNFTERRRARADYYTLAYGRTNASQTLSYGVGVTYLQQLVEYSQSGESIPAGSFSPFALDSNGGGVGLIAGVQYSPPRTPNVSVAASLMTPIDLSGNGDTSAFYDRVPGRALVGIAARRDGLRSNQDYLVMGSQVEYYFEGRGNLAFDRTDQTGLGVGLEYGYGLGSATLPIRVGYRALSSGGLDYGTRNAFTYGIGYRPRDGRYGIDLSWSKPQGGGSDLGISASYRF
ncbi:MAG: hypothetical protein ACO1SV_23490 [Fimbriimonas sp.]